MNQDITLFHHTVVAKILGEATTDLALGPIGAGDGAPEARHEATSVVDVPAKASAAG